MGSCERRKRRPLSLPAAAAARGKEWFCEGAVAAINLYPWAGKNTRRRPKPLNLSTAKIARSYADPPPHIQLLIRPRTADVSSQQFVQALLSLRATPNYPDEPPDVYLVESKGLDQDREKRLISCLQDKARELSSCSMLVAICEEAVELLSTMNHPEGVCPLCLYPLVPDAEDRCELPFMKLMSCFHCFHSECIIRWWIWLQNEENDKSEESERNCPVCRKVFQTKDLEHVLDLVTSYSSKLSVGENDGDEDTDILRSDVEENRRLRYENLLKEQQSKNGLIEPKKDLVVLPGMYITPSISAHPSNVEEQPCERSWGTNTNQPPKQQRRSKNTVPEANRTGGSSRGLHPHGRHHGSQRTGTTPQVKQWKKREEARPVE
ncbi:hypothetical protein MLD38_018512 [Melastoma candidum]|uniref:Uncharacterized protein n=1 Tax=Melastoma candidum TaxID=119954 RepID=A0ACB9R2B7_9MYRT|nr:hypothetical protein MLD38_018512 [Melastoma candidum]